MRASPVAVIAFPVLLIVMAVAERLSLVWLEANPASPTAWQFWLSLHVIFGRLWATLESMIGSSVSTHLVCLGLVVAVIALASLSRRWPSYAFLMNHAALLAVFASVLLSTQAKVSSLVLSSAFPVEWAITLVAECSPMQLAIIVSSIASCVACHIIVLRHIADRDASLLFQLKMLQQNL